MAPVEPVAFRPKKQLPRPEPDRVEIVEDDNLSIRSIDTRDSRDETFSTNSCEVRQRAISPPPKLEGIEEGMRCEIAHQYRNRLGLFGYRTEVPTEDKGAPAPYVLHPDEDWLKQFAVLARKHRNPSSRGLFDLDSVRVRSPLLKQLLWRLCKDYPGFGGQKGKSLFAMDMYEPYDGLFHCWSDLLRLEKEHADPETRDHIKLLHDLLEPHFRKPLKKLEECRMNGHITFNFLWTIFKPGGHIYHKDAHGQEYVETIEDMYYCDHNDRRAFKMENKVVCWDGKRFGYGLRWGWFYEFSGSKSLIDLPAMPLEIHPDRVAIKARMTKRGETFQKLAGCHLKAYTGPVGEASYSRPASNKATDDMLQIYDRIIINPDGVNCPLMATELDPLVRENPFDTSSSDTTDRVSSPGSLRRSLDRRAATDLRKAREEWDSKTKERTPKPRKGMDFPALDEEQMLICVPDVACFDLLRKEWMRVDVNEIGDVVWKDEAFDDLIWPLQEKEILFAVAESYFHGGAGHFNDLLDKASKGSAIMLNGLTGCGKAFAVEAVAEKLHMPLYTISVGEIVGGMIREWGKFEKYLEESLERCAKWNAILLIKNIDFLFDKTLEATGQGDTCATIAHYLEKHQGLVFMTSTKLEPLDPLLLSRFDLVLEIPNLALESRREVWANTLTAAVPLRELHFTSEHLDTLAQKKLTARQIKSLVKIAGMLANSKGGPLKMEHLQTVIKIEEGKRERKSRSDILWDDEEHMQEKNEEKGKGKEKEAEESEDAWSAWGKKRAKA